MIKTSSRLKLLILIVDMMWLNNITYNNVPTSVQKQHYLVMLTEQSKNKI